MKKPARRLSSLLAFVLLVAFLAPPLTPRAAPQTSGQQTVVARVTLKNRQDVEQFVALGVDLLEMRQGDDLFILTTPEQVAELRAKGWAIAIDKTQSDLVNQQQKTNTFSGGYRTIAEMVALLNSRASSYPNLAEVFTYGQSWEKVHSGGTAGRDLFGITLTNRQIAGPKPTFFLMAAIHARELTTSELALRFMDYLLTNYGTDGDITWLLDEHKIVIVPAANPDGRVIAEQGFYQRKNTNNTYTTGCANPPTAANQYGVDLNRNSHFKWGTINPPTEPRCGQTYPGPTVASEPETSAMENLVRSLFPDQRGPLDTDPAPLTTTGFFLTLHSYSNLVLWPWGWTTQPAPNATALTMIGQKFASYNSFTPMQSTGLYPTSGTTDDWAYGELGIPAMTFEVGPESGSCGGFFPPFSCLDGGSGGSFWPRNLPAFIYAARIARTPYQLALGPSPETATATSTGTGQFEIRTQLNEQYNGNQSVAGAEYYIDTPPWRGGTGIAMLPLDGSFNANIETATATLSGLNGRHLIYMRGRDALGNWGPVRGVFADFPNCAGSVSPSAAAYNSSGGPGSLSLTTAANCSWSLAASDNWISVTSALTGSGSTIINYEIRENFADRFRTGTINVAGQTYTVYQEGVDGGNCPNVISPAAEAFGSGGGFGMVNIFAPEGCVWAASNNVNWVTITNGWAGVGVGATSFTISANTTGVARKAKLIIGGQSFTIKQK